MLEPVRGARRSGGSSHASIRCATERLQRPLEEGVRECGVQVSCVLARSWAVSVSDLPETLAGQR